MSDLEKKLDEAIAATESAKPLTPKLAKDIIGQALRGRGIAFTKLAVKTVGFADLARGQSIFVTVHLAAPLSDGGVSAGEVEALARKNGFRVQFKL